MRVYVAGRTIQFERVREVQKHLIERGHEITFDWTKAASEEEWKSGSSETTRTDQEMEMNAWQDVGGVEDAEAIVILAGPSLVGTLVEFGIAIGARIPIFIVGKLERGTIFEWLPFVKSVADLDALDKELMALCP